MSTPEPPRGGNAEMVAAFVLALALITLIVGKVVAQ